ncbi:hypothetical protein C4572_01025 [Candidatus Parcubacteria bacterium]|nr:MAG: hypothetical protein C4572_01025 [Candidatus Parcubacteria bacterium]
MKSTKNLNILGLKIKGHNTGASLIYGDKIMAISEERLDRIKNSPNVFPSLSIEYCLKGANLSAEDIDLVVIDQIDRKNVYDMENIFTAFYGDKFKNSKIKIINHHLAHAASAFFASPFDEAAIMVIDGSGEKISTHLGTDVMETDTYYRGIGNEICEIQKTAHKRDGSNFPLTFGVGKLYSFLTETYIDLGRYNEGKMMGLASYGKGLLKEKFPLDLWYKETSGGHFLCNAKILYPKISTLNKINKIITNPGKILVSGRVYLKGKINKLKRGTFFSQFKQKTENGKIFLPINLQKPPRSKEYKLPDDYYTEMAWIGQKVLEEIFIKASRRLNFITGSENLCLAGGVALNGVSNNKILEDGKFKKLFIQPASSDTGIPLGCALWGYHCFYKKEGRPFAMGHAHLGKKYADKEIFELIKKTAGINFYRSEDIAKETARLIDGGNVVGWFFNSSEYGPRALGARSILGDPRNPRMKDILNAKVKHREWWRPFAASVLEDKASDYFEIKHESPFMLFVPKIKKDKLPLIPSLVHVDETCRIQTVSAEHNGLYYNLINEFYNLTGVPLLINTSFNDAGEPIIETPNDAMRCFLGTEMDYLIFAENDGIGGYVVKKNE